MMAHIIQPNCLKSTPDIPLTIVNGKNTATVTCLGADLNEVSALVESLESDQRVAHVTVSTAQGENDSSTSATIQIVFAGPLDVEGDGGSKEKGAGDGAA